MYVYVYRHLLIHTYILVMHIFMYIVHIGVHLVRISNVYSYVCMYSDAFVNSQPPEEEQSLKPLNVKLEIIEENLEQETKNGFAEPVGCEPLPKYICLSEPAPPSTDEAVIYIFVHMSSI